MKAFSMLRLALVSLLLIFGQVIRADGNLVQVGQSFNLDGIQATVVSVKIANHVGSEFMESKPAEGGEYIAVVWKYKNVSHAPIDAMSAPELQLIDAQGTTYEPDDGASASYSVDVGSTEKALSDINPGITIKDAVVFEISKADFDASTWCIKVKDNSDIKISLQSLVRKGGSHH